MDVCSTLNKTFVCCLTSTPLKSLKDITKERDKNRTMRREGEGLWNVIFSPDITIVIMNSQWLGVSTMGQDKNGVINSQTQVNAGDHP